MSRTIELSRGLVALVDDEDFALVSMSKWCITGSGYCQRRRPGDWRRFDSMHRVIMDPPPGFDIDHINGDRTDNRRANLRIVTRQQNMMNRAKANKNPLFKGVHKNANCSTYSVKITSNGRIIYVGSFVCPVEAARAYDAAAIVHHGEFAKLNFPPSDLHRRLSLAERQQS